MTFGCTPDSQGNDERVMMIFYRGVHNLLSSLNIVVFIDVFNILQVGRISRSRRVRIIEVWPYKRLGRTPQNVIVSILVQVLSVRVCVHANERACMPAAAN